MSKKCGATLTPMEQLEVQDSLSGEQQNSQKLTASMQEPSARWCCAIGFFLTFLIGVGEIILETWLVLHYSWLKGLTRIMVYLSAGFLASSLTAIVAGLLGFCGSIKWRSYILIPATLLMILSILGQFGLWVTTYFEQVEVADNLLESLNSTTWYHETVDYHYNCQLQNSSKEDYEMQLEICNSFLSRQLWIYTYLLLALCTSLFCVQIANTVVLIGIKLNLVKEKKNKSRKTFPEHPDTQRNSDRSTPKVFYQESSPKPHKKPTATKKHAEGSSNSSSITKKTTTIYKKSPGTGKRSDDRPQEDPQHSDPIAESSAAENPPEVPHGQTSFTIQARHPFFQVLCSTNAHVQQ